MRDGDDRPQAPMLLRLVAFALDGMFAVVLVFVARLAFSPAGTTPWESARAPLDTRVFLAVALLLVLRDVVFFASPAKWLLCLRLEQPDGQRLPFTQRWWRAPWSILPWSLAPQRWQRRQRWRVRTYVPSRFGLALRTVCTASAAIASVGWALVTLRPSISSPAAETLVASLVRDDVQLRRTLGEPVVADIRSIARRGEVWMPGTASFQLRLQGTQARQQMRVLARRVEGEWAIEELSEIEIHSMRDSAQVAER
ncbi:MAG TPA: hypothetical protein VFD07_01810 [Candidatus Krumholzibacteria bacterium]|nr:hypothetical protein [Candidatus Krumholzibacteria bacterium]